MASPSKLRHIARLLYKYQEMRMKKKLLPFVHLQLKERQYWLARAHEYLLTPAADRLNLWAIHFFNLKEKSL